MLALMGGCRGQRTGLTPDEATAGREALVALQSAAEAKDAGESVAQPRLEVVRQLARALPPESKPAWNRTRGQISACLLELESYQLNLRELELAAQLSVLPTEENTRLVAEKTQEKERGAQAISICVSELRTRL